MGKIKQIKMKKHRNREEELRKSHIILTDSKAQSVAL